MGRLFDWLIDRLINNRPEKFRLWCSRCRQEIKNARPPLGEGMTAGYYVVDDYWQRFCNMGERYVCDACMWADERYIAVYGKVQS